MPKFNPIDFAQVASAHADVGYWEVSEILDRLNFSARRADGITTLEHYELRYGRVEKKYWDVAQQCVRVATLVNTDTAQ